jgi:hypothetical protein
LWEWEAL